MLIHALVSRRSLEAALALFAVLCLACCGGGGGGGTTPDLRALDRAVPIDANQAVAGIVVQVPPSDTDVTVVPGYSYNPANPTDSRQVFREIDLGIPAAGALSVQSRYCFNSSQLREVIGFSFDLEAGIFGGSIGTSFDREAWLDTNEVAIVLNATIDYPWQMARNLTFRNNLTEQAQELYLRGTTQQTVDALGPYVIVGAKQSKRLSLTMRFRTYDQGTKEYFDITGSGGFASVEVSASFYSEFQQRRLNGAVEFDFLVDGASNTAIASQALAIMTAINPSIAPPGSNPIDLYVQALQAFLSSPAVEAGWQPRIVAGNAQPIDKLLLLSESLRAITRETRDRILRSYGRLATLRRRLESLQILALAPVLQSQINQAITVVDGFLVEVRDLAIYLLPRTQVDETAIASQLTAIEAGLSGLVQYEAEASGGMRIRVVQLDAAGIPQSVSFPPVPQINRQLALEIRAPLLKNVLLTRDGNLSPPGDLIVTAYQAPQVDALSTDLVVPINVQNLGDRVALNDPSTGDSTHTVCLVLQAVDNTYTVINLLNYGLSRASGAAPLPNGSPGTIASGSRAFNHFGSAPSVALALRTQPGVTTYSNGVSFVQARRSNFRAEPGLLVDQSLTGPIFFGIDGGPLVELESLPVSGPGSARWVPFDEYMLGDLVTRTWPWSQNGTLVPAYNAAHTWTLTVGSQVFNILNAGWHPGLPFGALPPGNAITMATPPFRFAFLPSLLLF